MKPRRIFYVTNARLPTEKAHGLATIKLAEAFARQRIEVVLFAPWRINPLGADPYEYYGVKRNFKIIFLPNFDFLWLGFGERFFFPLQLFSFSIAAAFWILVRYGLVGKLDDTVIFSHDHIPLWFISFFAPSIFLDIHDYPARNVFFRCVLRRMIGCAVQTKWKQGELVKDFGIPEFKIVYWPNGTDIECFDIPLGRDEARRALNLPPEKRLVVYAGSLQAWKGVDTLVGAARLLPTGVEVHIVGGGEAEVGKLRIKIHEMGIKNVVLVGQRPWQEIPQWLKAAHVLVLPNTAHEEISLHYTSPMKLFEYMASGTPIVTSDIPSIREIIDETMGFFAAPDDENSFREAIQQALAEPLEAMKRSARAQNEVRKYTWDARAKKVLEQMWAVR